MNPLIRHFAGKIKEKAAESERISEAGHSTPEDVDAFPDVEYGSSRSLALAMDIFRPKRKHAELPVIILVHGGGLIAGTRKMERSCGEVLAQRGYLVFVPEYHPANEIDAYGQINELAEGFAFVKDQCAAYGGDPERVTVFAESAGAYLALYVAASMGSEPLRTAVGCQDPGLRIRALVCISGMFYTTRRDMIGAVYRKNIFPHRYKDPVSMAYMNPEHPEVMRHLPPLYLITSEADYLKGYTFRYADALRRAGHPFQLRNCGEKKTLKHAFASRHPQIAESREAFDAVFQWLEGFVPPAAG